MSSCKHNVVNWITKIKDHNPFYLKLLQCFDPTYKSEYKYLVKCGYCLTCNKYVMTKKKLKIVDMDNNNHNNNNNNNNDNNNNNNINKYINPIYPPMGWI